MDAFLHSLFCRGAAETGGMNDLVEELQRQKGGGSTTGDGTGTETGTSVGTCKQIEPNTTQFQRLLTVAIFLGQHAVEVANG